MEDQEKRYIISCSGASNTGEYADRVARLLDNNEKANMVCMNKENIDNIINISITDYGIIKGQTPVVVKKIGEIAEDIINTKLWE